MDSYMFQTVGHHLIELYGQAMELPLYRRTLEGGSVTQGADYTETENDEVEDLFELLKEVKVWMQMFLSLEWNPSVSLLCTGKFYMIKIILLRILMMTGFSEKWIPINHIQFNSKPIFPDVYIYI